MSESRAVPSGKVYRPLFDAQAQLSRALLARRKDTRTEDCLSTEDSNTHCSMTSRLLCPLCSTGQQVNDDDHVDEVSRLPDSVAADHPSSDIIERLREKTGKKHKEALKQLETELTHLAEECEAQVRTSIQELLSSLQEVDLRLNTLKDRMDELEHLEHITDVCVLWDEVEEEGKLKKSKIVELDQKLTECETQRTDKIRVLLRKHLNLLEKIGFMSPPDVERLIHDKAMMLNQTLLANRRSVASVVLRFKEEYLEKELLLHLHWEDCLSCWRRNRVTEVIDHFRSLCSHKEEQELVPGQLVQEMTRDLTEQRRHIIVKICSLAPPSCSTALVSDWFDQLTAINQQIDSRHADFLHQLRCCYEQTWQERQAEVERCKEALSALQLSEEEVNDIVGSELLTFIERSQSQDKERLVALDLCSESVTRHAVSLSGCVFVVMRGAAVLWETHSRSLERREEEVQQQMDKLRGLQQQHVQRKKPRLDNLQNGLRQGSSEDALKTSLDKIVLYLQGIKDSSRQCVSEQWEVLDHLPSLLLEELLSYSSSLSSFFRLDHSYRPSPEELQSLHSPGSVSKGTSEGAETQKQEEMEKHQISRQNDTDPAQAAQDWLNEAQSSLLDLSDVSSDVTFTSYRGAAYSGPAFRCPAPNLQQETHMSLFPVELLTTTLSRMRTLFLDHLEHHFHDVLSSAADTVTDRKGGVRLEQELQLQKLNPEYIETHIYRPRLAELQLHRQQVDFHCEEMLAVLTSCRAELQELQTSISTRNQEFIVSLSNMEDDVLTADNTQRLEAVSATLQDCLDQYFKDIQRCRTSFRQMLHARLEEVRKRTTHLCNSFRLFSEGGDFAPQEVKLFLRRLETETKQISVTEESILSELEVFESKCLQQVKEASAPLEEKLSFLKCEVEFTDKIKTIIRKTHVDIKAEAATSNQQQVIISSRLEELKRMKAIARVSPDQVFSFLSLVNDDLRKRCQYLDFSLVHVEEPKKQVQSAPPVVLVQASRTAVAVLNDPVVSIVQSLNRFCMIQDAGTEERGTAAAPVPVPRRLQRRRTDNTLSARRVCRSIKTEKRFQVFGAEPEQNPQSLSSKLNSVLWKANDVLLLVAEDFYQSKRFVLNKFLRVPHSLDQWAEDTQQRLLGYQEQGRELQRTSIKKLETQLSELKELLLLFSAVLISNLEQQQKAGLIEEVGGVRLKLEETLVASEKEKRVTVRKLRFSLKDDELLALNSREVLRQQQLHSTICSAHLDLQVCLRVRGKEFVTSLASLTEQLIRQLDVQITPEEIAARSSHQPSEGSPVTMETGAETGHKVKTWSGIPYLSPPTNSTADPPSCVTMATTAPITTTRYTEEHTAVIELRDAAVKRFEELFRSESSRSDNDKRRRLSELQSWSTHWREQIQALNKLKCNTRS